MSNKQFLTLDQIHDYTHWDTNTNFFVKTKIGLVTFDIPVSPYDVNGMLDELFGIHGASEGFQAYYDEALNNVYILTDSTLEM